MLFRSEAGSGTRDGFESIVDVKDSCKYAQELTACLLYTSYSWIAAIVIALIVTFLPITLPFKIVLAMVAMACFYFGRKYYHNHKNLSLIHI